MLPEKWWSPLPHLCRGWLRAYIGATLIYLLSGFLWCFYIYYLKRNAYVPEGFAFHPLDGTLLMLPHFIAPFIVPMHFRTHMALVFMDAFWAANIHDCIHGKMWPFLGAGYHTVHHTTYRHNYGQYTIWMDSIFGTLREPIEDDAKKI
ncbi:hypothetical protein RD792_016934 [Penstemon davidsonii]|uniref:Fatty acid hydroxylase domain-containing protein n=1 Tax=Penstemon davidsonii TaxID=160366 RepID=A0ABR0CKN7_9LAMI|nr:hypothetical protein RD792_016934 [Penstemon davidsonii]